MLVGDILLSAREAVPDLPGTLPAPASTTEIHVGLNAGSPPTLYVPGTYYLVFTYSTLWGETTPGPEVSVTLAANQFLTVNPAPSPFLFNIATAFNAYIGTTPGGERSRYTFPMVAAEYGMFGLAGSFTPASPPQGNSAFLLDSGGAVVGAPQLFRWLSDALHALALANGGIPDASGFPTTISKQQYSVPGEWKSLDGAWVDGYPITLGSSKDVFRRNALNGMVGEMSYTQVADTLIVELYVQPNRTAGTGALSAAMGITDTSAAAAAGLNGWLLPFGLAMLGTPPAYEVVSYGTALNGLQLMVRGLGGTNGQAWPIGTPITELNCMFTGFRAPQLYTVGQASNTLRIPAEWTPYIHMYLLSRYRDVEQNRQEAASLMKEFDAYLKGGSKRKPVLGERQIQPMNDYGLDVRNGLSRTFGGVIIP